MKNEEFHDELYEEFHDELYEEFHDELYEEFHYPNIRKLSPPCSSPYYPKSTI